MQITPEIYLRFAKDVEPGIFENATPQIHFKLLNFINSPAQYKAAAVFRGSGKTTLLNKIFVLARVFFTGEPFTLVASSNEQKALNFLDAIKGEIDKASAKGYALERGKIWNKNIVEIIVNRGKPNERACYICSLSAGQDPRGANINNIRPTLVICDDLESKVGQYAIASKSNRAKLRGWFYADLLPAMHPSEGKMIIIGTILHDDSILNNIINPKKEDDAPKLEWQTIKIPIIEGGKSAWQSRFSLEKIAKIKGSLEAQGLANEFYQEYMCAPINPQKALFKREYFRYFGGVGYDLNEPFTTLIVTDGVSSKELKTRKARWINANGERVELDKCKIYTTIDLASGAGRDQTAIVTTAIDARNRMFVLDVSAGHWTPFEKSVQIIRVWLEYGAGRVGMEKAGMQNDFFYSIDVIQKMTGIKIPLEALTHHGRAKNTRISNLEPYYRTAQIYHDSRAASTDELEAQLIAFDPEVESKSDDLIDALAYVLEYVANRFFDEYDESEEYEESASAWI